MVDFKKILFPIHLSELSPKVAPYVRTMAQKFDAEIHLLHVAREFNHYIGVYVVEDSETRFKKLVNNLEKEISSGANTYRCAGGRPDGDESGSCMERD